MLIRGEGMKEQTTLSSTSTLVRAKRGCALQKNKLQVKHRCNRGICMHQMETGLVHHSTAESPLENPGLIKSSANTAH